MRKFHSLIPKSHIFIFMVLHTVSLWTSWALHYCVNFFHQESKLYGQTCTVVGFAYTTGVETKLMCVQWYMYSTAARSMNFSIIVIDRFSL